MKLDHLFSADVAFSLQVVNFASAPFIGYRLLDSYFRFAVASFICKSHSRRCHEKQSVVQPASCCVLLTRDVPALVELLATDALRRLAPRG